MKYILLTVALFACNPAHACGNGECEPETPSNPEPEKPTVDRDREAPGVSPAYYPCCIRDGVVVPKWDLFRSLAKTKLACELAIRKGNAQIKECTGYVSPEATK